MRNFTTKELSTLDNSSLVSVILQEELDALGVATNTPMAARLSDSIALVNQDMASHISYSTLCALFQLWEKTMSYGHLTAYIVFTAESSSPEDQPLPLEARTYRVSSGNKGYQPDAVGNSIYGESLDGSDPCAHLHELMSAHTGCPDDWQVEYCQLVEED